MKHFENRWIYSDGITLVVLSGLKNGHFYGVIAESIVHGRVVGHTEFSVREFGSYGAAKEYAMRNCIYGSGLKLIRKESIK